MGLKRVLFSWVGFADIRAMASSLPKTKREKILRELNISSIPASEVGPIKALLDSEAFTDVHLLSNYSSFTEKLFQKWIGNNTCVHHVELRDPTNYTDVFKVVDATLSSCASYLKDAELCIHLSPGTPTMTAIWVLLGKSKYPASFYQTHKGKARKEDIPFDLAVDFVTELLKSPDLHLQYLASQVPQDIKGFEDIIGSSHSIKVAAGRARRTAVRDVSVLLVGESGTGKELFAQAIHESSHRNNKPFRAINCAAIPSQLLESTLFGHKKGAFTGADKNRDGLFKIADGGTVFLDEIGECPLELQAKLLRVLEPNKDKGPCCRVFTPIGVNIEETSDVRIIAATNKELLTEVQKNRFREDLYYRLAVISINLPALRERREDIVPLAEFFLSRTNLDLRQQEHGYEHKRFSHNTKVFMKTCDWPGNVRQLNNAIVQAAVMTEGKIIEKSDIQTALADFSFGDSEGVREIALPDVGLDLESHLNSVRSRYLRKAMERTSGNKTKAARLLGMKNYQTLDAQLKRLGVEYNGI